MTKKLLCFLKMISKNLLYGILIQFAVYSLAFATHGSGQNIKETFLKVEKEAWTVKEILKNIEQNTGFVFVYPDEYLADNVAIKLKTARISVFNILEIISASTRLRFKQINNSIYVAKEETTSPPEVSGQDRTITGNITGQDDSGPLPGVAVMVKGTALGTTTDNDGHYSVTVPDDNAVLVFSFIGYLSQEVAVAGKAVIDITLVPDITSLEEVVVVGFGEQRKIETLGSQSSVKVSELKQPVANISTVLSGRIAGLVGVQRSAEPGNDGADIWIRGIATFSNSSPLILVDGIERSFSNLDPNDIESFTILKDASSTSVYGVRGANGVVLITTKKGVAGKPKIDIDYFQGVTQFTRIPEVADGITYMQMANEASVTRGGLPIYSADRIQKTYTQEDPYLYPNVNWFDQVFKDFGHNRKASLSLSGGSDKMTYYVSAGYYDESGLFKVDDLQKYNSAIKFTRYNFTSRLTVKPTKTTEIDLGIKGWISNGNYPAIRSTEGDKSPSQVLFESVFNTYPILYPVSYPDREKEPFTSTGGGLYNPYYLLTNRGYETTYGNNVNSDIRIKQDFGFWVKGLSAHILYSFDAANSNRLTRKKSPYSYYARTRDANGDLVYEQNPGGADYLSFARSNGGSRQFYLQSGIDYDTRFGKNHLTAMVLYNQNDRISATANDLIGSIPYRSLGLVGRVNYSYEDRYLAEASFGYNGAENFEPGKRFGFFPAMAVGWVASNEPFWGNLQNTIQLLKFRVSYGIVGNSNIEGRRFAYVATVANTTGYAFGQDRGNNIGGLDIGDYAASVTWETEEDLNIGVEVNTLRDALNVQIDVFNRHRENIFLSRASVPAYVGLRNSLLGNLGITNSRGVDISAVYNQMIGPVSLQARGTFTYNRNEVIENDQPAQPFPYLESRGHAIRQRFGYIAEGFYTEEEIADENVAKTTGVVMAGDLKFKDMNKDGVIDQTDMAPIGLSDVPQIVYGFGTTIGYKGFSLGAFFQGVDRVDLYLANEFMPFREGATRGTVYANITDRWTPGNPRQDAFYPRLSYGEKNQNYANYNSHWLMSGRFLRLKTLDFGYTIPKGALSRFGVQNMRVYFLGYNLLTFSPFKMFDPELGNGSGTRYPNIKTYSLGVNVGF
jgi:TonB-linked SusC/RagA family outer membrane protein